jgi:GH24 family phage-related lysozyme (muramidase)
MGIFGWLQTNVYNIIMDGTSFSDSENYNPPVRKNDNGGGGNNGGNNNNNNDENSNNNNNNNNNEKETGGFYEKLRKHIRGNEGFKTTAAWDVANWRIGYGTSTVALNSSLVGNDRLNPKNYITFTGNSTNYPVYIDLDTGTQVFYTLNKGHVEKYATAVLSNGVIWRIENTTKDPLKGTKLKAQNGKEYSPGSGANNPGPWGYTEKHAQQAFEYDIRKAGGFESKVKKWGPEGYKKLTDEAKIALIDLAYNYGSIVFDTVRAAIKSGDSKQVALALAVRVGIQAKKSRFWKEAKYVNPNIYNELTPEQQAKAKKLGYK